MPEVKTITASEFEKAFQAALPGAAKVMTEKVKDRESKGLPLQAAMSDISALSASGTQETFCKNWTKIKGFLTFAIGAVGFFMPGPAALAKAFIAAVESTILPLVCPTNPPAE